MFRDQWKSRELEVQDITHIDDKKPSLIEHCIEYSVPNLLKTMTSRDLNLFMQSFDGYDEDDNSPLDNDFINDDKADAADLFEEAERLRQQGVFNQNQKQEANNQTNKSPADGGAPHIAQSQSADKLENSTPEKESA